MQVKQVSIVIPSLNSPMIDQVLLHLRQQTAWSMVGEILVIGKDEPGLVVTDEVVRLIDTGKPVSPARARNIGIETAGNDLLLFLDSDCLPTPDWLAEHLQAHAANHFVVGGGVTPAGKNYWSLSYNLTLFHEFVTTNPAGGRQYLPTLNLSVQREVIEFVGLLNEDLARGQDIEWTARMRQAGYGLFFWPTAVIQHEHNRTTLQRVWRDCARSGFYMRQVRLQNPTVMQAPYWLRHRFLILGLAPLIAAGVTLKIMRERPFIFHRFWYTLPAIYLTKIAWCWGASHPSTMP